MKPRILIVASAITTLLLSSSLAFAQPMDTRDSQAGQTARQKGDAAERMNVPADKRDAVKKITDEYKDRITNLRQQIRSKYQELQSAMSQAQPDASRAKSISRDLANLKNQLMDLVIDRNVRITQETGVKMPAGMWKEGRDMMDDSAAAAPAKKARKAKSRSTYRDDNGTMYRDTGRAAPAPRDTMGRDTMGRDTMTRPDTTRDSNLPSQVPARNGQGMGEESGSKARRGVIDR